MSQRPTVRLLIASAMVAAAAFAPLTPAGVAGRAIGAKSFASASTLTRPTVHVIPARSVEDESIDIRVTGLKKGQRVSIEMRSTDAKGFVWSSRGMFVANSHGIVNPAHVPSISGSYNGVWSMGLIAAMKPNKPDANGGYFWSHSRPRVFTVNIAARKATIASTRFQRSWTNKPLTGKTETLAKTGFIGTFIAPQGAVRRTAVLLFGGSEGGLATTLLAARFAADGYPALALAYFREPGLPQTLTNIPLEYFQHALQWLGDQPQVNPRRMVVLGISRGSEAAQLVGVHYPDLVHGVIAIVPSNVALCGIRGAGSSPGCTGAAWTLNGKPVPYTTEINNPRPTDTPDAVIPDEQINGPLLTACGGDDAIWNSCAYGTAIIQRLDAKHSAFSHALYTYTDAGHSLGALIPYEPGTMAYDPPDIPGSEQAREKLWPHVLAFLRAVPPR